jgi:AmmeMemoRadiSam system protein B
MVIVFCLFLTKNTKADTVYHTSEWNEYAPEIERSIKSENTINQTDLGHVYGGVVSHHIPMTIPKLVDFYSSLKKTQEVKKFIIIGPDHTNAGKSPITVSNSRFFTVYGEMKPIDGLALKLQDLKLANIEEAPFDKEHSIGSQVLIISKIFPEAEVTPIILRSNTTKDQAEALGEMLSTF